MPMYEFEGSSPIVDPSAFVHPDATLCGDVRVGPEASVWPRANLTSEGFRIVVGARTSVQDGALVSARSGPVTIGSGCIIGHLARLDSCTVGDGSLVGSGSDVGADAVVEPGALVAAGARVGPGVVVPTAALAAGHEPLRIIRDKVDAAIQITPGVDRYVQRVRLYQSTMRSLESEPQDDDV